MASLNIKGNEYTAHIELGDSRLWSFDYQGTWKMFEVFKI